MKKFFTLIAAALLSSGAFAQSEWQNLVVNGDMEGEADPMWSSFWCHDWREGVTFDEASEQRYDDKGQFQGFAEIVVDPADPNNHCARVIVRSEAEADEAGNKVCPDGQTSLASWDCQFFIYANEEIPEGKELRMKLKVKAEKSGMFETQAHWKPGDYNHYQLFGNCNYGTEWTTIEVDATVDANHTQSANGKIFQSVAFNLSTMTDGNVIYFDDVKLEMREPKGPEDFDRWFNMLRHGTESADKVNNWTTFTGRDGVTGQDIQARVVMDPVDGEPALNVTAICYNAFEDKPQLDDEGNPVLDENGEPAIDHLKYHIFENGDTCKLQNGGYGIDDWQTQFFVTVPHKFIPNSQYRLVMWYRADHEADIDTQLHNMPGDYVHYEAIGTLHCTPEWQQIKVEEAMRSQGKGCQTIAFNCNKNKDELVNYYFRFDEFSFNMAEVSDAERTLGKEDILLPVPEPGAESATATIDFTNCMNLLESTDFANILGDDHLKLPVKSATEDDEYSPKQQSAAGVFIDDEGYLVDDGAICITASEDSKDNKADYLIDNFGTESFAGKNIETKMLFTYNDWNYVFNTKLIPAADYEKIMSGVNSVSVAQPENVIYDLQGRRVKDAVKGLYIVNGKKVVK